MAHPAAACPGLALGQHESWSSLAPCCLTLGGRCWPLQLVTLCCNQIYVHLSHIAPGFVDTVNKVKNLVDTDHSGLWLCSQCLSCQRLDVLGYGNPAWIKLIK